MDDESLFRGAHLDWTLNFASCRHDGVAGGPSMTMEVMIDQAKNEPGQSAMPHRTSNTVKLIRRMEMVNSTP